MVWSQNTARYKAGVLRRISEFLSEIESLQKEEEARYGSEDLAESTSTSGEVSVVLNRSELSACVSCVDASDSPTLILHVETLQVKLLPFWKEKSSPSIGAEAGYGSEENSHYLAQAGMSALVKYPLWHPEHTGKIAPKK